MNLRPLCICSYQFPWFLKCPFHVGNSLSCRLKNACMPVSWQELDRPLLPFFFSFDYFPSESPHPHKIESIRQGRYERTQPSSIKQGNEESRSNCVTGKKNIIICSCREHVCSPTAFFLLVSSSRIFLHTVCIISQ